MPTLATALIAFVVISESLGPACEVSQKPADDWGQFQSEFTSGTITVGMRRGNTYCNFSQVDVGTCTAFDPGVFSVQIDGQEQWLSVPANMVARLRFEGGTFRCHYQRAIRTD